MEDLSGSDRVHDFAACAKGSKGEAATNGFRQANHVRLDLEIFAGTAASELGAGLDFVEDQQRAVLGAQSAQAFEETGFRHADANIHRHRLKDQCRDLAFVLFEDTLNTRKVVEGCDQSVL